MRIPNQFENWLMVIGEEGGGEGQECEENRQITIQTPDRSPQERTVRSDLLQLLYAAQGRIQPVVFGGANWSVLAQPYLPPN